MSDEIFALSAQANLSTECARLTHAWEMYALGAKEPTGVRPVILESWNRCSKSGLDVRMTRSPRVLSSAQLEDYLENDPVYAEIKLALPRLEAAAVDLRHLLVCCDAAGHIMQLIGEGPIRRRADNMNFVPGADWSEYQAGTNAIGTAISTGAPIQVLGSEHYLQAAHDWTCSGAPIRDPATSAILAVLDMTGPREACHRHALVVLMTVAQLIEERLRAKLEAERYQLLEQYADQASRSPNIPIAVLDRGGRVVKASPSLYQHGWIDGQGRMLGCQQTKLAAGSEVVWSVEGSRGQCTFLLEPSIRHGRVTGSIVQIMKETPRMATLAPGLPHQTHSAPGAQAFERLIGSSPAFLRAISIARSAASAEFPVLIEGETGTGKELVAQAIHAESRRKGMPFVAVNCGALSRELATSEFFGYDGGSFTGAAREGRIGKFEQANGGTLFLDEIGDMPIELQTLLLRVVEDNKVVHLGGRKSIQVNVRVIAATNQDLQRAIARDSFRKDLYYRLNVLKITLPPLRSRQEDVDALLTSHLESAFATAGRPSPAVAPEVMRILEQYSWPGNVREVRNLAEWLAVNCTSGTVEMSDLPTAFLESRGHVAADAPLHEASLRLRELGTIHSVLENCTGNVTEAAKRLGIHRSTIYRKLGRFTTSQ